MQIIDPATGQPFDGNAIPASRISPQAAALLGLLPAAEVPAPTASTSNRRCVGVTRQDNLQSRFSQTLNRGTRCLGNLQYQRPRNAPPIFSDSTTPPTSSNLDGSLTWTRRFSQFVSLRATYQYLRQTTALTPYFATGPTFPASRASRGNDPSPENWGAAQPDFSSGSPGLTDGLFTRSVKPDSRAVCREHVAHPRPAHGDVRRRCQAVKPWTCGRSRTRAASFRSPARPPATTSPIFSRHSAYGRHRVQQRGEGPARVVTQRVRVG